MFSHIHVAGAHALAFRSGWLGLAPSDTDAQADHAHAEHQRHARNDRVLHVPPLRRRLLSLLRNRSLHLPEPAKHNVHERCAADRCNAAVSAKHPLFRLVLEPKEREREREREREPVCAYVAF